jgi:uncharacterized membrane protein
VSRYELLLFIHIAAVIIWLGAGFLLAVQAERAMRSGDDARLGAAVIDSAELATVLFIPASLTTFVFGLLLTIDSWSFDRLWIVLGLVGYAATFATGLFVLKPGGERIEAMTKRDGGFSPAALAESRRLLMLGRIDQIVLFVVVADMAMKPTGDDVGLLIAMAVVILAGAAWIVSRARAVEVPGTAEA